MDRSISCRLCGSRESFLVNLTEDHHHQVLLYFISTNLNVKLTAGPGCTVCGKCIGGLESWRQLKKSVETHQAYLREHHNEPSVPTGLEAVGSTSRYYDNVVQEDFNPSILQAVSLAPGGDPLSVTSIKTEAPDEVPSSPMIDIFHSTSGSSHFEIIEHHVKQEPLSESLNSGHGVATEVATNLGVASGRTDLNRPQATSYDKGRSHVLSRPEGESSDPSSVLRAGVNSAGNNTGDRSQRSAFGEPRESSASSGPELANGKRPDDARWAVPSKPREESANDKAARSTNERAELMHQLSVMIAGKNCKNLLFECVKCLKMVVSKDEIKEHWLRDHSVDIDKRRYQQQTMYNYLCVTCGEKFSYYNAARTHRKMHKTDGLSNERDDEEEDDDEKQEEVDVRRGGDAGEKKLPVNDKERVALEILRAELLDTHYKCVGRAFGEKPNEQDEIDPKVKIETLESLVKTQHSFNEDKTVPLVTTCSKLIHDRDKVLRTSLKENVTTDDLGVLEDSKVSLVNVIVKTENIYTDAMEENSDYKHVPMNNNSDAQNRNVTTGHFLVLASSENSPSDLTRVSCDTLGNSLGDDLHSHEVQTNLVKDNFQCNLCNVYFDTIPLLGNHMRSHTFEIMKMNYMKGVNTQTEITCELCSSNVNVVRLKKHLDTVHKHDFYPLPEPKLLDNGIRRCRLCLEEFKRTTNFESHAKPCFMNDMVMRQLKQIAQRMNQNYQSENILDMEVKGQGRSDREYGKDFKKPLNEYASSPGLPSRSKRRYQENDEKLEDKHTRVGLDNKKRRLDAEAEGSFTCEHCGLKCGTKLKYDIHKVFHGSQNGKGLFECHECDTKYTTMGGARNHLKRVHLRVDLCDRMCTHCLRTFPSYAALKKHTTMINKRDESEEEEDVSSSSESNHSDSTYVGVEDEDSNDAEDSQSSQELMDTLKANLRLELGASVTGHSLGSKISTGRHRVIPENEKIARLKAQNPFISDAIVTNKLIKSKELKSLNMNCTFQMVDRSKERRSRRDCVPVSEANDRGTKANRRDETRRDHIRSRSSSVESASSSRTRSSRSSNITPREQSPDHVKSVSVRETRTRNKKDVRTQETPVTSGHDGSEVSKVIAREKPASGETQASIYVPEPVQNTKEEEYYYDINGTQRVVYKCQHCGIRSITNVLLKNHENLCKEGKPISKPAGVCTLCNIYFSDVRRHYIMHGNIAHRFKTDKKYIYVFQCPICMTDMKSKISRFNRHLEQCKSRGGLFKCKYCKRNFVCESNKMQHQNACSTQIAKKMMRKAKTPILKCTYCCRHIQQTKENHDYICTEPIAKGQKCLDVVTLDSPEPESSPEKNNMDRDSMATPGTSPSASKSPNGTPLLGRAINKPVLNKSDDVINKCDKCDKTFSLRIAYKKHISKCCKSGMEEQTRESAPEGQPDETSGCSKALSCFLCDTKESKSVALYNHYWRKHNLTIESSGTRNARLYKCLYCLKQCKSFLKFNLHGHFHEKQKQTMVQPYKPDQTRENDKTEPSRSEKQKSVTPTRGEKSIPSMRPLSVTTREKSKANGDKQQSVTEPEKHNVEKTKPLSYESVLTTRAGTHVRPNLDETKTNTPSRNHSATSPARATSVTSPDTKSNPDDTVKKKKTSTELTRLMNTYKSRKSRFKKRTKCENCKIYISNNVYTKHAVLCIRNSAKQSKRTENAIIMSGYVKKKKNTTKMFCIHCKTYMSNSVFPTHLLKCERKNSYRVGQNKDENGKEKPTGRVLEVTSEKRTQASVTPVLKNMKPLEIITPKTLVRRIEDLSPRPKSKKLEVISPNSSVKVIEVTYPKTKAVDTTPPKGNKIIEVTYGKADSKQVELVPPRPTPRVVNLTVPQTNRKTEVLPSKINSNRVEEISSKFSGRKSLPLSSIPPHTLAKIPKVVPPPMVSKSSRVVAPPVVVPQTTKVIPQPVILRHIRDAPPRTRQAAKDLNKIHCPLCLTDIHNKTISSHYNFYHKLELSWAMYAEVLGLKKGTAAVSDENFLFCPFCEKMYKKDMMRYHYRHHRKDVSYSLFIELLGFRSERDFEDFLDNKHIRQTRSKVVEVIDLDDVPSPPTVPPTKGTRRSVELPTPSTSQSTLSVTTRRSRGPVEPEPQPEDKPKEKRSSRKRDRPNLDDSIDENLSLADLLQAKRSKRRPTRYEEPEEEVLPVSTKRGRPPKNILETSDTIILNENDSDLSEHGMDDPLADPFSGCHDGPDKLSVDTPYRSYTTDEESTSNVMEDEIAVLEDWESLEKKTEETPPSNKDVSSEEIEKKRQLAANIKSKLQEKIDAILNRNKAESQAKRAAALAEKPADPPVEKPNVQSKPMTSQSKPMEAKVEKKPERTVTQETQNTVAKTVVDSKVNSPKNTPSPSTPQTKTSEVKPPKQESKVKPETKTTSQTQSENSPKPTAPVSKSHPGSHKVDHRVEHKVSSNPTETVKHAFVKTEKLKNKLLMKFKKETSRNSYTVSPHKPHQPVGSARPEHQGKKFLNKPKSKDHFGHIMNKQSDKNVINKLREIKINRRKLDEPDCSPNTSNTLHAKVQSISKDIKSNAKVETQETRKPLEGQYKSGDGVGTPAPDAYKRTDSTQSSRKPIDNHRSSANGGKYPSVEQSTLGAQMIAQVRNINERGDSSPGSAANRSIPSEADTQKTSSPIVISKATTGVTFSSTFVPDPSPPPAQPKESTLPPETSSVDLLEAPGSPLFPPPPPHLQATLADPAKPMNLPSSYSSVRNSSQDTKSMEYPKAPESPDLFPTLSKTVGAPQLLPNQNYTTLPAAATYTDLPNAIEVSNHSPYPSSQQKTVTASDRGSAVFEIKHGVRNTSSPSVRSNDASTMRQNPSYQGSSHMIQNVASPGIHQNYSNLPATSVQPPQHSNTPPQQSQHYNPPVQYSSTHGAPYVEYSQHSPTIPAYVEYPKPSSYIEFPSATSSQTFTQRSTTPAVSRSNTPHLSHTEPHHASPPSPYPPASVSRSHTPAMSPAPAQYDTPSSPMMRPASRGHVRTPGIVPSPSPADTLSHVPSPNSPSTQSSQQIKLPPVSTLVQSYRNTKSPYPYTSNAYQDQPRPTTQGTPEPSKTYTYLSSPSPASPSTYPPSSTSNLTDNLLAIPNKRRETDGRACSSPLPSAVSSSSYTSPSNTTSRSYASPNSQLSVPPSAAPSSVSPNYAQLSTAYPISSAYATPTSTPPAKKKPTPPQAPAVQSPSTYTSTAYETPSTQANLISYPVNTSAGSYTYSTAYPTTSLYPSVPPASYGQGHPSYITYPPVESHEMPPASQSFRPYESPYQPPLLAYDYGSAYNSNYLPPGHPGYPPAPGQYVPHPRPPSPSGYYNPPPDTY
ncbi:hypothetical protein M8J77_016476 [Diaphorina citri]|nr:hypothetical protein M8J77_016476 [Diaphorina citri]